MSASGSYFNKEQQQRMNQHKASERRATFRVAVKPNSGLHASFVVDGEVVGARAGNLSAEGIFIRPLDRRALPRLEVGEWVTIDLEFEGEEFWLSGIVRSYRNGGYGVYFPPNDRKGYKNPRQALGRISRKLEREEITQRIEVLKLPEDGGPPPGFTE